MVDACPICSAPLIFKKEETESIIYCSAVFSEKDISTIPFPYCECISHFIWRSTSYDFDNHEFCVVELTFVPFVHFFIRQDSGYLNATTEFGFVQSFENFLSMEELINWCQTYRKASMFYD